MRLFCLTYLRQDIPHGRGGGAINVSILMTVLQPFLRVCVWRSPFMGLVSPTMPAHVASLSRSEAMPPREAPRLLLNGMEKNPLHGHGGRRPRGLREFRESTRRACVRPYWHVLCCVGFSTRGTKTARGVSFGTNMQGEPSS